MLVLPKESNCSSKYKGVSLSNKGKWQVHISIGNRKQKYLGCYDSEEEAARVYNEEAKKIHGKFARLNQL